MTERYRPETSEQLRDLVAWAAAEETPLDVAGSGSKRVLGRPGNSDHRLDLTAFNGIEMYEPEELVLTAGAGTPLADIENALAVARQQLAFEPPDLGPLLGAAPGAGTLGGLLACNFAGPRRVSAGAARDHFLGFEAISGRGEAFKSGGRVVKNVTGYDLSKLMCGSWGTLGVMTTVTVKVLPVAEKAWTVLVLGLDAAQAGEAMSQALQSPYEVSGAAYVPADLARASQVSYVAGAGRSVTAIRIEGPGPSVEYRCKALRENLGALGETEELHSHNSGAFWREVRDVAPFVRDGDDRCVWKLSVPPTEGPALADTLALETGGEAFLDWGGGLIWLAVDAPADAAHETVRAGVARTGGHATLMRAPEPVRAAVPVFHPPEPGVAALLGRVKESFDPRGILNPGRMYPGM